MSGDWASGDAPPELGGAGTQVVLFAGSTFCLSANTGDVAADRPHGLFVADTRVISEWLLQIDGAPATALTSIVDVPYAATFVGRATPPPGQAESSLLVVRRRYVGGGLREDIVLRNLSNDPITVVVTLSVAADFADLFEVKEGRTQPRPGITVDTSAPSLSYALAVGGDSRTVRVTASGAPTIAHSTISFDAAIAARSEWSTCVTVEATVGGRLVEPDFRCDEPLDAARSVQRMREWDLAAPIVTSGDPDLGATIRTSAQDLGALQIADPQHPQRRVVAAGAPWFMALFGRDSLLTSWMALPLDRRLALGTLQALAEHQGTTVNPITEEQPGRIPHEIRLGRSAAEALGGASAYYGNADATALFVALLGELERWGIDDSDLQALLPAADRALAWIEDYGDVDGDGFVEYHRATDHGLFNQGWKDSFDGINDADGRMAELPIALAEVQAYVYAAYLARASIAASLGDEVTETTYRNRASALKAAFNARFWLRDRNWFAVALDGAKRPLDSLTSNPGHCLWCGIVDDDKAQAMVTHLMSPEMWTGFGIRTLASDMGAYNPMSYHNGSVWPHDTAIGVSGLMRYGFVEQAQQVALGVLDAARSFGGRLPELFSGFDKAEFGSPVPFPTSCSPQAWAAAAPVHLLRTLLRLDPDLPRGKVAMAPAIPRSLLPLRVENLPLGDARLTIDVSEEGWEVSGLPDGVRITGEDTP